MEKVPFFGWMFPQHDLRNLLKILRKWNGLWSHMFNFEWLMFADLHRICLKAHRVHKPGVRLQFLPYMFETREHVLRQHVKSHWWIFRMGRGSRCEGYWQKKKTDRGRGGFHINHLSILLKHTTIVNKSQAQSSKDICFKVLSLCSLNVGIGQVAAQMKFFGTVPVSSPMVPGTPAWFKGRLEMLSKNTLKKPATAQHFFVQKHVLGLVKLESHTQ